LINKFKCRYCDENIALTYPFLELMMGVMFFLTASLAGVEDIALLIFYLFITFVFVVLTFYDILFKEVPDEIVIPAFVIAVIFMSVAGVYNLSDLLIGIVVPILFFGTLFFVSKGRWLGGGDIRIGALMGALLAWPNVLIGLFLGYLFGAVYSLFGIVTKQLGRRSQIPFAPFLLIGTYITMFWGQKILDWYLHVL
ncbi:A24 family peptidase, partial [Patescibacteria group bacterium]|nr:A24 family peptidase [Patescibacteria group bacterium]